MDQDAFRHHPQLRDLIADPLQSQWRDFRGSDLDEMMAERGLPPTWRVSDEDREAARRLTPTPAAIFGSSAMGL